LIKIEERAERDLTHTGLANADAAEKLKIDGPNELPSAKPRSPLLIALGVVREPMFLLLVAYAIVYLILGDKEGALMLVGAVGVVIGITLYQEQKTERTLQALRDLSSPRALVIRGGEEKRIPGREVVTGDLIVLSEGDRVPADCPLISGHNVAADESLLTGESVPARKVAAPKGRAMERPGGDDLPFLYSGTLVVQGRGVARVESTGVRTEVGKIGKALQGVPHEATLLERNTKRLVRTFAIVGLSLCMVVVVVYGLSRGDWLKGVLAGITMAISMIPEEFPVVLTIFLALGAWRIAQKNVLTRHVTAIETLGAATVLCVDKTGTLTQNQMSVTKLGMKGVIYDVTEGKLPDEWSEQLHYGVLASQPEPFDPMEKAIHILESTASPADATRKDWVLVRQYALSPQLLAMSQAWKAPDQVHLVIAAKGAPEAMAELCRLTSGEKVALDLDVKALAQQGLRVIAVAKQDFESVALHDDQREFSLSFLGLLGFADPVRPAVPAALMECYSAGVRVIMITGDYPETAQSIARQIGLRQPEEFISGPDLGQMTDADLTDRIRSVNIFARVMPEQKLRLVNALKSSGEIVAMTGDGVNDAPALKSAHIGIAMGKRGTDVAREAADLVLLDDDFSSIVQAIRLGRRIFTNIKDAMAYIMAVHVPIAGLSLLPVLLGWPLILLPVHIVFLELVIDPACSVVFEAEPEDAETMQRPPRDSKEPMFTRARLILSLLRGAAVLAATVAIYAWSTFDGRGENAARTLCYTTLIVANLGLIVTNLSWSRSIFKILKQPNPAMWLVLGGVSASIVAVLSVPFLRNLFRFSVVRPLDLAIAVGAGILSVMWFELVKLYKRKNAPATVAGGLKRTESP